MENAFLISVVIFVLAFFGLALVVIIFVLIIKKRMAENKAQHHKQLHEKERLHLNELISIQETERKRIARNIHDQIHPLIYSLRLNLESQLEISDKQKSIITLCEHIQEDLSAITDQLAPRVLYAHGLIKALQIYLSELIHVDTHFQTDIPTSIQLNERASMEVYRILLELIHNLQKHEKITKLHIQISSDVESFIFRINHDKPGFTNLDFELFLTSSNGHGLKSIHLRTIILQAKLLFTRSQYGGIELQVKKHILTPYPPR